MSSMSLCALRPDGTPAESAEECAALRAKASEKLSRLTWPNRYWWSIDEVGQSAQRLGGAKFPQALGGGEHWCWHVTLALSDTPEGAARARAMNDRALRESLVYSKPSKRVRALLKVVASPCQVLRWRGARCHDDRVGPFNIAQEQQAALLTLPEDHTLWRHVSQLASIRAAIHWAEGREASPAKEVRGAWRQMRRELHWAWLSEQTALMDLGAMRFGIDPIFPAPVKAVRLNRLPVKGRTRLLRALEAEASPQATCIGELSWTCHDDMPPEEFCVHQQTKGSPHYEILNELARWRARAAGLGDLRWDDPKLAAKTLPTALKADVNAAFDDLADIFG